MIFMKLCTFHTISIKVWFLEIWPNALPHGVKVAEHYISVEFWVFHVISSKNLLVNWEQPPCGGWEIKDMFCVVLDITSNFHYE